MASIPKRETALQILKKHKADLYKNYGVTKIGIFGSVARGEADEQSDLDLVIQMKKPDLFTMVHIKELMEEEFHCPVDIVHYRNRMNLFLKKRIDKEAKYV